MHIFLTSDVYINKKSVVKIIQNKFAPEQIGGFTSYFGLDDGRDIKSLYMCAANAPQICDDEHAVAYFFAKGLFRSLTERFDKNAVLLKPSNETKLIVMDKCSYLESNAEDFKAAVSDALNGPIPVLGVVRTAKNTWTKVITEHPNVKLIKAAGIETDGLIEKILTELSLQA